MTTLPSSAVNWASRIVGTKSAASKRRQPSGWREIAVDATNGIVYETSSPTSSNRKVLKPRQPDCNDRRRAKPSITGTKIYEPGNPDWLKNTANCLATASASCENSSGRHSFMNTRYTSSKRAGLTVVGRLSEGIRSLPGTGSASVTRA